MTSCCVAKLRSNVVQVGREDRTARRGDIVVTDTDLATDMERVSITETDLSRKFSDITASTVTALEKAKTSQLGCCCKAAEPPPSEAKIDAIAQKNICCTQGSGDNMETVKTDQNTFGIDDCNIPLEDERCGSGSLQGNSHSSRISTHYFRRRYSQYFVRCHRARRS
jgi:hypothetical protein